MSTSDSTTAHASGDDAPHGPDHVHHYETGIAEGNLRVPPWFVAVITALLAFFVYYIVSQWGAQPSSARFR